jgi:hypothetical protein
MNELQKNFTMEEVWEDASRMCEALESIERIANNRHADPLVLLSQIRSIATQVLDSPAAVQYKGYVNG